MLEIHKKEAYKNKQLKIIFRCKIHRDTQQIHRETDTHQNTQTHIHRNTGPPVIEMHKHKEKQRCKIIHTSLLKRK